MTTTVEAENIAPVKPVLFQVPSIAFDDVCDGCGKKPAHVAYNKDKNSIFMFCTHHGLKYEDKLKSQGYGFEPALPTDIRKIS